MPIAMIQAVVFVTMWDIKDSEVISFVEIFSVLVLSA